MDRAAPLLTMRALAKSGDFRVGPVSVSPSRRLLEGPTGSAHLQPQVMLVFLCLAEQAGIVVPRHQLFDRCWGGVPVGNDSLNRAITAIRQALGKVSAGSVSLETIPRAGYRLVTTAESAPSGDAIADAVEAAYDRWRAGLPQPDIPEIERLSDLLDAGASARDWGILALLLRKAAEYVEAEECAKFVSRCEFAARKALALDPKESNALVALTGLTPIFRNWTNTRTELLAVLGRNPDHVPALHDFVILEMSTGRPSVAAPILDRLLERDPLAATFHYKAIYQRWTVGRLHDSEEVATKAMALWPTHPAIWMARFWTFIFTERAEQAMRLVADERSRPPLTPAMARFLAQGAALAAAREVGNARDEYVSQTTKVASIGPANALAALTMLCALSAIDHAFEVARGYYLAEGRSAPPLRWNADDPSITDQHRRVTQVLFIPAAQQLRDDPRFLRLCEDIGLAAYWEKFGITPDFLNPGAPSAETNPNASSTFAATPASNN